MLDVHIKITLLMDVCVPNNIIMLKSKTNRVFPNKINKHLESYGSKHETNCHLILYQVVEIDFTH